MYPSIVITAKHTFEDFVALAFLCFPFRFRAPVVNLDISDFVVLDTIVAQIAFRM